MKNNFKFYRKKYGYTQGEIAKKLHVSRQSYIKYENGDCEPSFETLKEFSRILSTSIDSLLDNKLFIDTEKENSDLLLKQIKNLLENNSINTDDDCDKK